MGLCLSYLKKEEEVVLCIEVEFEDGSHGGCSNNSSANWA